LPKDGMLPTELTILATGVYDLGFIGVGPGGLRSMGGGPSFLEFWKERLRRDCVNDAPGMRFRDQRWIDLVPAAFRPLIVHDPTVSVAYWNLHDRALTFTGGRYEVDGAPLRFFHFSGFDPDRRYLLSTDVGDRPRLLLSEQPLVRRLVNQYYDLLVTHGHGRIPDRPWLFDTMANGVPMDRYVRHIYGDAVRAADHGSDCYPPIPWDDAGAEELCDWLVSPPRQHGDPGQLSVYLASVFGLNEPKLRPRYFNPQFADRDGFLAWARLEASAGRLIPRLVTDVTQGSSATKRAGSDTTAPSPRRTELRSGIEVAGYLRAELGVGEGARLLVTCLDVAKLPHSTFTYTGTSSRQDHVFEPSGPGSGDFDIAVVCVNANHLALFTESVGSEFFEGRHVVGQWAWELEEFPDLWPESFETVDEIWAVSEFSRQAIAAATDKPVFAFPHAIVAPSVPSGTGRAELGLPPDTFVFLFCLDLLSILERKNPVGLIEAYRLAFPTADGTTLVIKVINGDQDILSMERIRIAAADRDDILVLEEYLSHGEIGALMDAADCYVSLHRSEGFGLTMAEAMALGKPVIATRYSGNLDFMDDDNAYLVPWTAASVPEGCYPYPAGARWADPDLDVAARIMRHVFEHPEEARDTGARARSWVTAKHSPAARAHFLKKRFAAIEEDRAGPRSGHERSTTRTDELPQALGGALRLQRLRRYQKAVIRRFRSADPPDS
jgi:glycosyltransferase involved in cell wall biosynthesis